MGINAPGENRVAWRFAALASFALALIVLCLGSPAAHAQGLYRYVDERGVVHFTNVDPADARYRSFELPGSFQAAPKPKKTSRRPVRTFDRVIRTHSMEQGIPPALVKAVIHAESAFDPQAVSPKGAMGLMQLMPDTAKMLGVLQPFQAEDNIDGGVRYLARLHDRYGSWTHTLAAYNAGPTAVDRFRGVPPYAETREYVRRVLSYYRRYHGDFSR
ncbi:MAG: lytic transglycosylase domain-containing protein [Deltaproteobacteria bacterium]|nr:lytic transglycosylase domain-containing protein [Deltaproteobacteria bacterium]MBW2393903.1 lytic transglycosylase domain-containing protein [Deltaproteobacteria bacterium]